MSVINDKAKFAVEILLRYQHETGVLPRSTSDLSPLEEWLIIQMYQSKDQLKVLLEEAFEAGDYWRDFRSDMVPSKEYFNKWLAQKGLGV